jgi:hypothetical protein
MVFGGDSFWWEYEYLTKLQPERFFAAPDCMKTGFTNAGVSLKLSIYPFALSSVEGLRGAIIKKSGNRK